MFTTAEYKTLAAISDVLFLKLDCEGTVLSCSEPTARILGYQEGDLVGKNWFETCLPTGTRELVWKMFSDMVAEKIFPIEKYQNEVLTREGNVRVFSFANHWERDSQGKIVGVLSSGFDVTEELVARQQAVALEKRLESLFRIAKLRSPSVKDLLDATLHEAIALTGSSMGYIYFTMRKSRSLFSIAAWAK